MRNFDAESLILYGTCFLGSGTLNSIRHGKRKIRVAPSNFIVVGVAMLAEGLHSFWS